MWEDRDSKVVEIFCNPENRRGLIYIFKCFFSGIFIPWKFKLRFVNSVVLQSFLEYKIMIPELNYYL